RGTCRRGQTRAGRGTTVMDRVFSRWFDVGCRVSVKVDALPSSLSNWVRGSTVENRRLRCAVKGAGPQREINPPGNWIAPPGSNRSGGGGNKAAGASGVEGRIRRLGESVGCNASER